MREHLPPSLVHLWERARQAFWLIPACCVAAALLLAVLLPRIDTHTDLSLLFPGDPNAARSALAAITTALITLTGVVFTVTVVALQLAAGQFSPRVMRDFLRDRVIQCTFGVFVATFTYAMVVQRSVRGADGDKGAFVPSVAVSVAFLLVLGSIALFIAYINRISNSIRVADIVARIGAETAAVLDVCYGTDVSDKDWDRGAGGPDVTVRSVRSGVMVSINAEALVLCAQREDCVIEVLPRVGDFVPLHAPILAVHGAAIEDAGLLRHLAFDTERSYEQDVAFGFRELVDIAERALSPAVNDPTTACQAIDILHDLLRRAAVARPVRHHADVNGELRLVVPTYSFAELLELAVAEILHYGADDIQVPVRLRRMIEDVRTVARAEYQPPLAHWLAVLPERGTTAT